MLQFQEQAPGGEQSDSADTAGMSPQERERLRCAADIKATLKAVGLDEEAVPFNLKASSKKQKKNKKHLSITAASKLLGDEGKDQPHMKKKKMQGAELDQVRTDCHVPKSLSGNSQGAQDLY